MTRSRIVELEQRTHFACGPSRPYSTEKSFQLVASPISQRTDRSHAHARLL